VCRAVCPMAICCSRPLMVLCLQQALWRWGVAPLPRKGKSEWGVGEAEAL